MELIDIAEKLLTTLHINVVERKSLTDDQMPFSVLVEAADRVLKESGFLPPQIRPNDQFEGILLESDGTRTIIHERHEVGMLRFSSVDSTAVSDLREAVRIFLRANGGDRLDGVRISFDQ